LEKKAMFALFQKKPRAFYMIFMIEIWERFGFYTLQGILILYFIRILGFNQSQAYFTFGAFSALVYGLVVVGGYLGDIVLGTKRTILLGLVILALGYLALAINDGNHIFLALGLVCVGNGLFKANPSSLLAKCYDKHDPMLHTDFTLYYMAINLGSCVALLVGPALSSRYGYSYAYMASFIGLFLGCSNYWFQRQSVQHIATKADNHTFGVWQWLGMVMGIVVATLICAYLLQHVFITQALVWISIGIVLIVYLLFMHTESIASRWRMVVALILMLEAIVFFTLYQQMPTSLNLFAVHNVVPVLLGIRLDPQSFQVLNTIWIIVLSPVIALFYNWLNVRHISFSTPYKFALGMTCCGLSFSLLFFSRFMANDQGMVSSWWLVISYLFQSIGELLVSALGVTMVSELVPMRIEGFVMGMWFLTSSIAGFLGATVASLTTPSKDIAVDNVTSNFFSLTLYTHVFGTIGLITLTISGIMWLIARQLNGYFIKHAT
jgi:POT family proton-dependent oligopeptide transporter